VPAKSESCAISRHVREKEILSPHRKKAFARILIDFLALLPQNDNWTTAAVILHACVAK